MTPTDIKVLYILGWGRSGSTIIDNLLGEVDGFFSAGELTYLWQRGLIEGRRCGCGALLRECEVWSSALNAAFGDGGGNGLDPKEVVRWQREAVRVRQSWRVLRQQEWPTGWGALDAYVGVLGRIYPALSEVTGARVIVDSSKRPSDAAALRLVAGVTPYFVHLVRDPRAVAYSWRRRKEQPDRDRPAELAQHGPIDSTISWVVWNLAAEALRSRAPAERSLVVRYEDFVASPRGTLGTIVELAGEPPASLPFKQERVAQLSGNHTASGNPSRFKTGAIELREDTEWMRKQRRADRLAVTGLALPLLRRYGYAIRPHDAASVDHATVASQFDRRS